MAESKSFFSVRRLRWALVAAAILLLLVLAGFIGYARYRAGKFVAGLPGHLGVDITSDTRGFTYSQTYQGRTVFTLHAAKEVQHADGKLTLHDVGIVLYGRKGDRADRIHGQDFEYDQKNGIVTAAGDVYIDLAPPAGANKKPVAADDDAHIIHLKTSGLTYNQKEQIASTDKWLEFRAAGMTGTAVGAVYDADKGSIVLQSQVHVSGLRGHATDAQASQRSMVLNANHAELDRIGNVAILESAKLVSATDGGTQVASAQHAVVHMTADGTPQRVDANGNVSLTTEGRGTVTSDRLQLDLNAAGQPSAAHLAGVVRFTNNADARQEYAKADDARIAFDTEGRPTHATIVGNVEADVTQGASTRWLGADTVELALAGGGKLPVVVRNAKATARDGARLRLVDAVVGKDAAGKPRNEIQRTDVRAAMLTGRVAADTRQTQVTGVDGVGRTVVERSLTDAGAAANAPPLWRDTGTGDTLKLDFKQGVPAGKAKGAAARAELARAEQRGNVKIVRESVPKASAKKTTTALDVERAEGEVAVYEADSDRATLTGQVKVADAESALFADRVAFDRATGDATAEGSVRVSYLQQGSTGEPVHVLASRAISNKATGVTKFFAAPGGNVRMWQAGSQVEAPLVDFNRTEKTMLAHGAAGAEKPVKTVLVDANPKPATPGKPSSNAPVRVLSREMLYTDVTRQIDFRGGVQVNDQDGVMRAQDALVFLAPKDAGVAKETAAKPVAGAISLGGRVDRIVATGKVEMEQPGRKATGEKLVYTAVDRTFVLTGTKAAPPVMTDQGQGSVTGDQLRFRSGDDSVEVLGGDSQQRVHTETHLKQKEK